MIYSEASNIVLKKQIRHVFDVCELLQQDLRKLPDVCDLSLTLVARLSDCNFIYVKDSELMIAKVLPSISKIFKTSFTDKDMTIQVSPIPQLATGDSSILSFIDVILENTKKVVNAYMDVMTSYFNTLEGNDTGSVHIGEPNRQVPFAPIGVTYNRVFFERYGWRYNIGINSVCKLFSRDICECASIPPIELVAIIGFSNDMIYVDCGYYSVKSIPVCIEP